MLHQAVLLRSQCSGLPKEHFPRPCAPLPRACGSQHGDASAPTLWMPSGAAMMVRNRMRSSGTPLSLRIWTAQGEGRRMQERWWNAVFWVRRLWRGSSCSGALLASCFGSPRPGVPTALMANSYALKLQAHGSASGEEHCSVAGSQLWRPSQCQPVFTILPVPRPVPAALPHLDGLDGGAAGGEQRVQQQHVALGDVGRQLLVDDVGAVAVPVVQRHRTARAGEEEFQAFSVMRMRDGDGTGARSG